MRRTRGEIDRLVENLNAVVTTFGQTYRFVRHGAYGGHKLVKVYANNGGETSLSGYLPAGECYEAVRYFLLGYREGCFVFTTEEYELVRAHQQLSQ